MAAAVIFMLASASSDAQVYGLVIGDRLELPECSRMAMPAVKDFVPPYAPITAPCTMSRADGGVIAYPASAPPRHVVGTQLGYRLTEGKLDVVFATTAGAPVQDAVISDLAAKFGAPQQRDDGTATTAAGAVLRAVRAQWTLPNARIEYLGVAGRADAGELVVGTPAGIARYRDEQRRAGGRQTPM